MKIGDLARRADTRVETIRYYEREGLLPDVERTSSNYRHYAEEHLERLVFVRHCRSLDMSLDEVRVLLRVKGAADADCGDVNALLDDHIGHVNQRIRELQQLARQLKRLRESCSQTLGAAECGILQGLASAANELPLPRTSDVPGVHGRPTRR